jgi:hypothetical protein
MQKITREILPLDNVLRTSKRLSFNGLQSGMPTGHPNSTSPMSIPILVRSLTGSKLFSQSRTGSPPAAVRKK